MIENHKSLDRESGDQPLKRARKSSNGLKLPTRDEQSYLRETENLFKSNLVKLQTSELLMEMKSPDGLPTKVEKWVQNIVEHVLGVEKQDGVGVKQLRSVSGLDLVDADVEIDFVAPVDVCVVGSSKLMTGTKPYLNVDIAMTIPDDIFTGSDVLNHSYFDKRKLYLAVIADHLGVMYGHKASNCISFGLFKGDVRKPMIILHSPPPPASFKTAYEIHIIPTIDSGNNINKSLLKINKNNVRPKWWQDEVVRQRQERALTSRSFKKKPKDVRDSSAAKELDASQLQPTHSYNMCVLEDMVVNTHFKILAKVFKEHCVVATDIVVLLKIWLSQKSFRFRYDSMDGHTVSLLVAFLVQHRVVHNEMNSFQGFQTVLKFLVEGKFTSCVYDFTSQSIKNCSEFVDKEAWLQAFPCNLLHPVSDATGAGGITMFNVLWRLSASALKELQLEASHCLSLWNQNQEACPIVEGKGDVFESTFLRKTRLAQRYDMFFHMPFKFSDQFMFSQGGSLKHEEDAVLLRCVKCLSDVLHFALSDRVSRMVVIPRFVASGIDEDGGMINWKHNYYPTWSCSAPVAVGGRWVLTVALSINHTAGHRRVDKDAGDKVTVASLSSSVGGVLHDFASFWGKEVCKLRRFQDGGITEAVVWGNDGVHVSGADCNRAEQLISDIVHHCILRFIPRDMYVNVHAISSQLEKFLPCSSVSSTTVLQDTGVPMHQAEHSMSNCCRNAVESLDKLRLILTSKIKGLPLFIERLSGTSSHLRYTSLFPVLPNSLALSGAEKKAALKSIAGSYLNKLASPISVLATLESSGHWPSLSSTAFEQTKNAYFIKLLELLKVQFNIESHIVQQANACSCLDIFQDGYIFRLNLCCRDSQGRIILFTTESGNIAVAPGVDDTKEQLLGCGATPIDITQNEQIALYLRRFYEIAPLHHQMIHNVHSQYGSGTYAHSVRLLSYWLSSQMFSGYISHEALELLVASVFTSGVSEAPTTSTAGFVHTLLLLSEHNWGASPLLVDGNVGSEEAVRGGDSSHEGGVVPLMKQGVYLEKRSVLEDHIRKTFSSKTKRRGAAGGSLSCMHITAPYEKSVGYSAVYCQSLPGRHGSPDDMILQMIRVQAKAAADRVMNWMEGCGVLSRDAECTGDSLEIANDKYLKDVMARPHAELLARSSCVLQFNKSLCVKNASSSSKFSGGMHVWNEFVAKGGAAFSKLRVYANLPSSMTSSKSLIVRTNEFPHPLQEEVVDCLRNNFESLAYFFWNHLDGREVHVVLKPAALLPQKFSIMKSHHMIPLSLSSACLNKDEEEYVVLNTGEVVSEMLHYGDGLIENVVYR